MMEETNMLGQVVAILAIVGFCALWVAIAVRREKVRDRQRMQRLRRAYDVAQRTGQWPGPEWDARPSLAGVVKVSGVGRTVGPTSDQDRSEA